MQAVVMACVPFGMQGAHLPAAQRELIVITVTCLDDTLRVDGHDVAVEFESLLPAVHGLRSGDQFRRVGHVGSAARMNNAFGRSAMPA